MLIEGTGDQFDKLNNYILKNKLQKKVILLGFNQYSTHSWIIRNSHIIVIPSHDDNWGIVVDEGLILNKIVISLTQLAQQ